MVVGGARCADELDGILGHHIRVRQRLVVVCCRSGEAVHKHHVIVPVDDLVVGIGARQLCPARQVDVGASGNKHLLGCCTHRVIKELGGNGNGHVVVLVGTLQIGGVSHLLAVDVHVYSALTITSHLNSSVKHLAADGGSGSRLQR